MTQSSTESSKDLARPELPEKLNGRITEQFLDSNRQRIPVTIQRYPGQAEGDRINLYSGGPDADVVVSTAIVTQTQSETTIHIDAIKLRKLAPGTHAMFYDTTPKSGTPVRESSWLLYQWLPK
ncbi:MULTISPECIES: hypothetical protein [unclassified Pseudomonas]|jgi:hypothetical protein|uniref:hypothetical protein n=1 Tax=unclassified Pseudomonas TaxID=196821 RepID=UPI0010328E1D|nr:MULTISPECIES: hypothetical protein [unclassified Pseudomonas]